MQVRKPIHRAVKDAAKVDDTYAGRGEENRRSYVKDAGPAREAAHLHDDAKGGGGDANAGKSMKRVSSQQASPFSRAAKLSDMGRRGNPDDEVMP